MSFSFSNTEKLEMFSHYAMDSDFSSLKSLCDISVKFLPGLTKLMMSENTNLRMSLNINYKKLNPFIS